MAMKLRKMIKKILKIASPYTREELISAGARVGDNFYNGSIIDGGHLFLLTIGNNVTLSACRILLHDASTKQHFNHSRVGRVEIGDNVFVGAGAIILPNVKIGSNVIIAAGSIVCTDIPSDCVAGGNPCKYIKSYDEFIKNNEELMKTSPVFFTPPDEKTEKEKKEEYELLKDGGFGFDY